MERAGGDAQGAERIAGYSNSYQLVTNWADSTGFRSHSLRFKDVGRGVRGIGEQFLAASRYRRSDRETEASIQGYFLDPGVVMLSNNDVEDLDGRTVVPLPEGVRLRRELGDVLGTRRSIREYTGDPIPLQQVATVLRAIGTTTAVGHIELLEGGERTISFRTTPSPGGLYPVEVWMLALHIDGLPRSVWRMDAKRDLLVEEGDEAAAAAAFEAFDVPEEVISLNRAALAILMISRPWKVMRKYGDRGIRFLFIEAGAMAENAHLACGSLGLGSVDCASVHDDELHEALQLDGEFRTLAHAVLVGVPALT